MEENVKVLSTGSELRHGEKPKSSKKPSNKVSVNPNAALKDALRFADAPASHTINAANAMKHMMLAMQDALAYSLIASDDVELTVSAPRASQDMCFQIKTGKSLRAAFP